MGKVELRLEIDASLLADAEARGVSLGEALEDGVRAALGRESRSLDLQGSAERRRLDQAGAEVRARRWAEENAEAIQRHNERIEERGVWGEDLRRW